VHVIDSRYCAGKAAHDHTLVADTHINFWIKDYRKELECKISVSVALKAPVCTLFNVLVAHLSGLRSVYALPLRL
jgi:hypothetical protein